MGRPLLLDLDTLLERPQIRIRTADYPGGRLYELRVRDELSPKQLQTIFKRAQQGSATAGKLAEGSIEDIDPAELQALEDLVDEVLRLAFVLNYDDFAPVLSIYNKIAILHAFTEACLKTPEEQAVEKPGAEETATASAPTGAS